MKFKYHDFKHFSLVTIYAGNDALFLTMSEFKERNNKAAKAKEAQHVKNA